MGIMGMFIKILILIFLDHLPAGSCNLQEVPLRPVCLKNKAVKHKEMLSYTNHKKIILFSV